MFYDNYDAWRLGIGKEPESDPTLYDPVKDLDWATVELDGIWQGDYPDFCDAYIAHACWLDGTELTEEELDKASDANADGINALIHAKQLYR